MDNKEQLQVEITECKRSLSTLRKSIIIINEQINNLGKQLENATLACNKYNDIIIDDDIIKTKTNPSFFNFWITEGHFDIVVKEGVFNGRGYYNTMLVSENISPDQFSLKKYYRCLRDLCDMRNLTMIIEGQKTRKLVYIK